MLRELTGHTDSVNAVDVSRDGRYVLTGSDDKTARLWDAQSGQELREFIGSSQLSAVAFSPDGAEVLTGGFGDRIVRLWRTDYHDVIRLVCEHLPRDFTSTERVQYDIADTAPTCAKP